MIELDRVEAHNETIRRAGAHPIGEHEGLVWFTDPATKSTLILEPEHITEYDVMIKIATSRLTFAQKGMISEFYRRPRARHDAKPA